LVWVKALRKFYVFDSSHGANNANAQSIAAKLAALVDDKHGGWKVSQNIVFAKTPRQPNGHDCGVYVLAISEALISHIRSNQSFVIADFETYIAASVTQNTVTEKRKQIGDLINKLAKE